MHRDNHDTTGLLSFHSILIFFDNNTIVNNSGIFRGGIAFYDTSEIYSREPKSFLNNHASISGGGIFVSQLIGVDINSYCFLNISKYAQFYFVNNSTKVSGDVLYGGNFPFYNYRYNFDDYFHYTTQTGLICDACSPLT